MPVRKPNNASPRKLLGMSPDTNRVQHLTESALEADNLLRHMFDPNVERFEVQPLQLKFHHEGRIRKYTPDVAIKYWNSDSLLIEEVKPHKIAQSEKFRRLEHAVRLVLETKKCRYSIVTEDIIRAQPRHNNLEILFRYRAFPVTNTERYEALSWFADGSKTLRTARLLAAKTSMSIGVIFWLIANHQLSVDLDKPFDDDLIIQIGQHHD